MKKTILLTILLLTSTIIYSQKSTNNCFADIEIDSLYSKFIYFTYKEKENDLLKEALTECNAYKNTQKDKIGLLENNVKMQKSMIENQKVIIAKKNTQIENQKELTKIERKKKLPTFIKGLLLGGGITAGIILIN